MRFKHLLLLSAAFLTLAVLPAAVKADAVTLVPLTTSATPVLLTPGGAASFTGTLLNNDTQRWYITGSGVDLNDGNVAFDTTAFDTGVQAFLDPGDSFAGSFFDVFASISATPGSSFVNTFTVFVSYNADFSAAFEVNEQFWLRITQPTPPGVPEPTTMVLLGTGLAGVAASLRKRRNAKRA